MVFPEETDGMIDRRDTRGDAIELRHRAKSAKRLYRAAVWHISCFFRVHHFVGVEDASDTETIDRCPYSGRGAGSRLRPRPCAARLAAPEIGRVLKRKHAIVSIFN